MFDVKENHKLPELKEACTLFKIVVIDNFLAFGNFFHSNQHHATTYQETAPNFLYGAYGALERKERRMHTNHSSSNPTIGGSRRTCTTCTTARRLHSGLSGGVWVVWRDPSGRSKDPRLSTVRRGKGGKFIIGIAKKSNLWLCSSATHSASYYISCKFLLLDFD